MIVWAPERFGKGKQVDELVQLMDLGPTILEWAGIEVPDDWEAISLSAALEQREDWKGREYVYCEQARDAVLTGCEFMTMVRSQHHKLVHFLDEPHGQLFDLDQDPMESDNLWDRSEHRGLQESLLAELREWRIRSGLKTKDWSSEWR